MTLHSKFIQGQNIVDNLKKIIFCPYEKHDCDSESVDFVSIKNFRFDEGKKVGETIEAREVLECSALLNEGVQEVFNRAASIALEQRPKNKGSCPCSLL